MVVAAAEVMLDEETIKETMAKAQTATRIGETEIEGEDNHPHQRRRRLEIITRTTNGTPAKVANPITPASPLRSSTQVI